MFQAGAPITVAFRKRGAECPECPQLYREWKSKYWNLDLKRRVWEGEFDLWLISYSKWVLGFPPGGDLKSLRLSVPGATAVVEFSSVDRVSILKIEQRNYDQRHFPVGRSRIVDEPGSIFAALWLWLLIICDVHYKVLPPATIIIHHITRAWVCVWRRNLDQKSFKQNYQHQASGEWFSELQTGLPLLSHTLTAVAASAIWKLSSYWQAFHSLSLCAIIHESSRPVRLSAEGQSPRNPGINLINQCLSQTNHTICKAN